MESIENESEGGGGFIIGIRGRETVMNWEETGWRRMLANARSAK